MNSAELRCLNLTIFTLRQNAIDLSRAARRARELACWSRNPKSGMSKEMQEICRTRFEGAINLRDDNAAMLSFVSLTYKREASRMHKARLRNKASAFSFSL